MTYFRELPNILYPSNLVDKESSQQYIAIKNLFRRVKLSGEPMYKFIHKIILSQRPIDTKAFYKNER